MMMMMMELIVLESLNVPDRTVWRLKWVRGGIGGQRGVSMTCDGLLFG